MHACVCERARIDLDGPLQEGSKTRLLPFCLKLIDSVLVMRTVLCLNKKRESIQPKNENKLLG